ncbi:MAG: adenylate/guanylate cyclase domain-containing protein [Thermodesulfobacteriota bacterium]|nr:adenylate/guanylate cyclase domain-containing protein [Thermodesulfobacteriota bacterium]
MAQDQLKKRHKLINSLAVGFISALLALSLWSIGWLYPWECRTWDWRARVMARPGKATKDILIIKLDQKSLEWAKNESGLSWPWPREVYSAIVNQCKKNNAKALGIDVLYTEPSFFGVNDDKIFGTALSSYGKTAIALQLTPETKSSYGDPPSIKSPFSVTGLDKWIDTAPTKNVLFKSADLPIPEIISEAAVLGNVNQFPDSDGVYRYVHLFGLYNRGVFPSLGFGTFLAAEPDIRLAIDNNVFTAGNRSFPVSNDGSVLLRYRGPSGTYESISAAWVLQQEFRLMEGFIQQEEAAHLFKDKYVLFGFTAPGLHDLKSSPVDSVYTGLEIHATLLDNFLSNDFMQKLPVTPTILLVLCLSLFSAMLSIFYRGAVIPFTAIVSVLLPVGMSVLFYKSGYWMPMVVMETSVILTIMLSLAVKYATEGKKKRYIKNAFRHYLSPHVINELLDQPDKLKLGGERKTLSIFFSDLQGFTTISEGLSPEGLAEFLNDYLSEMTDIILEEDGTVDKYEGDAIIAFWNAPLEVPDHALSCVRAALRCQARLGEMRPEFRKRLQREVLMRIGINTGPAVVGNLGSRSRFDYTMLGDSVNLAARLEGVNKAFGTYTMVSQFTRESVGGQFAFRELGKVTVVGKTEPITIYEPMSIEQGILLEPILENFEKALALFYKGDFLEAEKLFSRTAATDPPAAAYMKKCIGLAASTPANWNGVWTMTQK